MINIFDLNLDYYNSVAKNGRISILYMQFHTPLTSSSIYYWIIKTKDPLEDCALCAYRIDSGSIFDLLELLIYQKPKSLIVWAEETCLFFSFQKLRYR